MRKHCGAQKEWRVGLGLLQKKCGSNSTLREFRRLVMNIIREDRSHAHMPDYTIDMDEADDTVVFFNRHTVRKVLPQAVAPQLDPDVYETARMLAPGHDVHFLEREWRSWLPETPIPRRPSWDFAASGSRTARRPGDPGPRLRRVPGLRGRHDTKGRRSAGHPHWPGPQGSATFFLRSLGRKANFMITLHCRRICRASR